MKIEQQKLIRQVLVIIMGIAVILGLLWVNYRFSSGNPGGNDFLVHYVGTRAFISDGISPYSEEVALRIQTAAYGRAAEGIEHELRVAYPLYSILYFAPFSIISDYNLARAAWMTVLEFALVGMCFLSFSLVEWKPTLLVQGLILLFSLLWYHAVRAVINGNAVILIALILTLVFYLIKLKRDRSAGVLLALTTIKPHLVILLIFYILIWALVQKRKELILWFLSTMLLLVGFAWVLIPNWILQNLWEILRYPDYNPAGTLAAALGEWFPGIAGRLKWGLAAALGLLLGFEWRKISQGGFERFFWTGMLTLVISQWIGIQTDPGNFILLFPALILIIATLAKKWQGQTIWIVIGLLGTLLVGLWVLFLATVQRTYQPVQNPVMFLPLPAAALFGLYWIKWWVMGTHLPLWISET